MDSGRQGLHCRMPRRRSGARDLGRRCGLVLVKIRGRALPTSANASTATGKLMAAVATARGRRSRTGLARTAAVADGGVWTTLSRQTALDDGGRADGSSRTALTRRSRAALEARPRADGCARGPDGLADGEVASSAGVADGVRTRRSRAPSRRAAL
ncbi:hypothetical protein SORBI_3003G429600 [Sorghum bicolor]|uniref:Uncharacterized protein n=1 Tax=Sorghum bicolor TaxID=4558 RepID=A0A1B6Q888_SORBI|nr:hypothetical protein SORBI_3003G429600 [Sorghum bicolor]